MTSEAQRSEASASTEGLCDAPHRACRLTIDIRADTRDELIHTLSDVARRVAVGDLTIGACGGVSSGYIYHYSESDEPTPEEYRQLLREYLARKSPNRD